MNMFLCIWYVQVHFSGTELGKKVVECLDFVKVFLALLPQLCNQPFPEMLIDRCSEKKLLNVLIPRSSEDLHSLNFMMCTPHTYN